MEDVFSRDAKIKIVSVCSGKALRAHIADGGPVVGQSWNTGIDDATQLWRLNPVPGTRFQYEIEHVGTGQILAVDGMSEDGGAWVRLSSKSGPHTRWRVIPVGDRQYAIVNATSGKAMDIWDGSADDDAPIGQAGYWAGPRQRWRLSVPQASPDSRRAVMTLVRNESVFLPIWLRYYSRFFAPPDIYVLDHQSTDGSTNCEGFVRIPVLHNEYGVHWQHRIVQYHQHQLIDHYDVVLYADADEIVAPDPRYCDLGEYIDRFDQEFATCQGYEILHKKEEELPFDETKPVLAQRSSWYPNGMYSKPLLARVPMLWGRGFHRLAGGKTDSDPNLYLIHLHRMDYSICLARHEERSGFPLAESDRITRSGYQNYIVDPAEFANWFYEDSSGGGPIRPQRIPAYWRDVV
jgi:hypothetical protein